MQRDAISPGCPHHDIPYLHSAPQSSGQMVHPVRLREHRQHSATTFLPLVRNLLHNEYWLCFGHRVPHIIVPSKGQFHQKGSDLIKTGGLFRRFFVAICQKEVIDLSLNLCCKRYNVRTHYCLYQLVFLSPSSSPRPVQHTEVVLKPSTASRPFSLRRFTHTFSP